MNLYTVTVGFADFNNAVIQIEANNHLEALKKSLHKFVTAGKYDSASIEETLLYFLRLNKITGKCKGVWTWHHVNSYNETVSDLHGGIIVKTDKHDPLSMLDIVPRTRQRPLS